MAPRLPTPCPAFRLERARFPGLTGRPAASQSLGVQGHTLPACHGSPTLNLITVWRQAACRRAAQRQSAQWPATSTQARCVFCKACTPRATPFATTCWCIHRADWSAATRWRLTFRHMAIPMASSPRRAPRGFTGHWASPRCKPSASGSKTRRGLNGCRWRPSATTAAWLKTAWWLTWHRRLNSSAGTSPRWASPMPANPSRAAAFASISSCRACGWSAAALTRRTHA